MIRALALLVLVLAGCSSPLSPDDPGQTTAPDTAACAAVNGWKAALGRSGCTVPDVVATAPTCADAVADTDACWADGTCRLAVEASLLDSCTGLIPLWTYYSAEAKR